MNFKKIDLKHIFYNNTFVYIFSLVCAVAIWFYMAANNALGLPKYVYDVPITITLSETAQNEGVKIFDQNINKAKVSITGSNFVINQITADDLEIIATLSPMVNKLTGKTTLTDTITLVARKKGNDLADYQITGVLPENIEVTYDRYKEKHFKIENHLEYTPAVNYYLSNPEISDQNITVSGPESSINKIDKVVINHTISTPVSTTQNLEIPIALLNEKGEEINPVDLKIQMSIDRVSVNIEAMSKQTVTLEVPILNLPEDFSPSRIKIYPETIDIAGDFNVVSQYTNMILSEAIDFKKINMSNLLYRIDIPMPEGVKNVSNITSATIVVNMNGYEQVTIPTDQIIISNIPEDKEVTLVTQSVDVNIVGANAQVTKITSDDVYGTIDMAGLASTNGDKSVPVKINITSADTSWVIGEYTVYVTVSDKIAKTLNVETS